ncbi:hypothetical protein D3C72_1231040 [compost metagenome]
MATVSPSAIVPDTSVPVTTVPKPCLVKTRSIGSRSGPEASLRGAVAVAFSMAAISVSSPWPEAAATGTTGASARKLPWSASLTSSTARAKRSGSTRSVLVTTTRPLAT